MFFSFKHWVHRQYHWWWSIDHKLLGLVLFLMGVGGFLVASASPAITHNQQWSSFIFVQRHYVSLLLSIGGLLFFSTCSVLWIKRIALTFFIFSMLGLICTLFGGTVIKGGRRWILFPLWGIVQPSEFVKPFFLIVTAMVLQKQSLTLAIKYSGLLLAAIAFILFQQPDIGTLFLILGVWSMQIFAAGVSFKLILGMGCVGTGIFGMAYMFLPHVARRVSWFFPGHAGKTALLEEHYQVNQSIQALHHGGFWGQGPGAGTVKQHLPDAHTDFIFSVGLEECGMFFGILILGVYIFLILRLLSFSLKTDNFFKKYTLLGIAIQIFLQVFINIGSALAMIPSKGMTLPFLSYGGSSLLSLSFMMGIALALTTRYHNVDHEKHLLG